MKKQHVILLFALLFSFLGFSQNGNIQGAIIDEKGLPVPFANILIEADNKGVISDADGKFLFVNVSEGNKTIKVMYLGYADTETQVEVQAGKTVSVTIFIRTKALELENVVINSYNNGQAKALNAQKNKQNITNVVSTDQIGKFPDANIGDAVKRIPGITMQVDQGEARNVIVRGLAPQLNSVTLNGSRIPSAEGDNRNIQMDLIPSDMIQLIEVNKAVTPDMDADALGGSVNLVTRTSPNGFRAAATLGSGINFITDKRIVNASFLIGDKSKNGKFGWMASASMNDSDFGSDNIEAEWTDEFAYYDANTDEEVEMEVNPYANVFEQRTYIVQRIRRSFSVNLDYAFNANNKVYLKSMYNWRDDRENRYRLEHEILDAEDIEIGDFTITNNVPTMFPVEVKRQTKGGIDNDRNKNARLEDQRMQNYSLGGEHLFGKLEFDWMASYAKASEERLNERYMEYESKYIINNHVADSEFPLFTPANSGDNVPSNFEFGEITEENQYTDEKDFNVFANFKLPLNIFNSANGFLKFGGRIKLKEKQRDNNFFEFEPLSPFFDTLTGLPLVDQTDKDYLAGSQYAAGFFADPEYLGQLNLNNEDAFEKSDVPDEYLRANYNVEEKVYAAYAMTEQKLSDKLNVMVGVRVESTKTEATGNQIEDEEDLVGTITDEKDYVHILPGVHFKYNVSDNTILRFAWTNTLARPNYADVVPTVDVVNDDEEIFLGNPELSATESMNFDVMAEHYFKGVGILSGGAFYKDISDFIYVYQFEDAATGYDAFQPQNGDDASILGAEVSFQRQLDFLPGFLKNLSLMANYTYLTSSADGVRNEDGDERTDLDLPGTAPNMFNGSLAYNSKKLNIRLSANYSDAYIDEIGGSAFEDRHYDEQFLLDFNASYAFNDNLRLYVDVNNITDQPLRYFQGVKNRTMQAEYYGRRLTFGLKYDIFKPKN
ncbi:TonB-dependent receptor [Seonamhaeicola algicola]|uniref:TonB-dependent receptor n=2 Tax=Seonamhaeicola TaxID=1649495 RepID=A0A5C7ALI6_9FLAO|nr:TonB-dependent receptor [Seonamhaeicola algicola]TXE09570.1 TonB-dependent receptor [Seonamhaeicola algicola]